MVRKNVMTPNHEKRGRAENGGKCRDPEQPKASYLQLPMAVRPDAKRFFQVMNHQFPSFSVNFRPSVQNRSTFQLIYQ